MRKAAILLVLCIGITLAAQAASALDGALFFVNDPRELTFADLTKVSAFCENYYRQTGILNSKDMERFFEVVRSHGAPNAGMEKSLVGLVVQDAAAAGNGSGVPRGVLVIYGTFDKEKALELLRRNYDEHMTKTAHDPVFSEGDDTALLDGKTARVHTFGLPAKNRELTMVSFGKYVLFHSAAVGDRGLLQDTVRALADKNIAPVNDGQSSVRYNLVPTGDDKAKLVSFVNKKYEDYKQNNIMTQRKGLRRFLTNRIANHKVEFVNAAIGELGNADIQIERMRNEGANAKRMTMVSTFSDEDTARKVKKNVLKHLNDVIKNASNPQDKLGMSNNVRITAEGPVVKIETQLATEEEQLHTFAIVSSFIARSMVRQ